MCLFNQATLFATARWALTSIQIYVFSGAVWNATSMMISLWLLKGIIKMKNALPPGMNQWGWKHSTEWFVIDMKLSLGVSTVYCPWIRTLQRCFSSLSTFCKFKNCILFVWAWRWFRSSALPVAVSFKILYVMWCVQLVWIWMFCSIFEAHQNYLYQVKRCLIMMDDLVSLKEQWASITHRKLTNEISGIAVSLPFIHAHASEYTPVVSLYFLINSEVTADDSSFSYISALQMPKYWEN